MKTDREQTKRKASKAPWSRLDQKLFRLNLAIYQTDPGEPVPHKSAGLQHQKAS